MLQSSCAYAGRAAVDFELNVPDHFRLRSLWIVSDGEAVKAQPPAVPQPNGLNHETRDEANLIVAVGTNIIRRISESGLTYFIFPWTMVGVSRCYSEELMARKGLDTTLPVQVRLSMDREERERGNCETMIPYDTIVSF